ncbi:hypothetical protein KOW79_003049 [Hemibagrus wyckioides]|uniref:Uncharacterized protein n=1 Tax=Hemibagrus wyckioides TaxID=337641 RepID=A0A9D3SV11_9TELE|nr:hypothetical protein KOW79_003049 [Hemibagrus wyckioides]
MLERQENTTKLRNTLELGPNPYRVIRLSRLGANVELTDCIPEGGRNRIRSVTKSTEEGGKLKTSPALIDELINIIYPERRVVEASISEGVYLAGPLRRSAGTGQPRSRPRGLTKHPMQATPAEGD